MSPWRPLPGRSEPPEPRPVGDSLAGLAHRLGAPSPEMLTTVFARWEEIVGPAIAAHAWPLTLSDRVLRVGVDQPGWATQLRFLGADLLRQLAEAAGDAAIDRIEIKVVGERRR